MAAFQLNAREMDQRLTLKRRGTPTKGARGQEAINWVYVTRIWAKYAPAAANERFAAAQTFSDVTVRFFARHRDDVDATWRLEWKGVGYDIVAATALPGRQWMELLARKGVKDGR